MQTLPPGDLEGLELVGSGGFGRVYKGRSKKLGMVIALKILDKHSCAKIAGLMKEKDMMMKASSTYVLRVLAVYTMQDKLQTEHGLVMEYMPHGSLHSLFNTFNEKEDLVPWALRFQILHQVALAMNFLHGLDPPIIHRDLKPQNVLLRKDLDVQLTDFGLARNETSVSTTMAGTVSYMPPESFVSAEYKPTKEFDVYSFGILIWSILSGQEPYNGVDRQIIIYRIPDNIRPDMKLVNCWKTEKMVPEAIEMMERCWDGDPKTRPCFADCMERLEKMEKAYDGEIEKAVFEVLTTLRAYCSSQENPATDTTDSIPEVSDYDLNSSKIDDFINRLNLESPSTNHNKSFNHTASSGEIIIEDAEKFLKSNYSNIVQEKPGWDYILDNLFTQDILTGEEMDRIRGRGMVQDQIRETLKVIMNQGRKSCRTLVQLLIHYHPSVMRNLTT